MPVYVYASLGAAAIIVAALMAVTIAGLLRNFGRRKPPVMRVPDPEPEAVPEAETARAAPLSEPDPPAWLIELEKLGFRWHESADVSITATAPQAEYAVCVSRLHPNSRCTTCDAHAIRMLGETPLVATHGGDRIHWIGWACGRCGSVDLTNPNAPRFLNLLLADSRSMLSLLALLRQHGGKPFNEMIAAALLQNEGVLQARLNRSAALRAGLPAEKKAKVLLFQKRHGTKKRRRDLL